VTNFGVISRPLTNLLKKNILFIQTPDHEAAFSSLKRAAFIAHVLSIPNFTQPFAIETNACDNGVRVAPLQYGHPLAFINKALGTKTKDYPPMKKNISPFSLQLSSGDIVYNVVNSLFLQIKEA
jgi:hypothetical protein